MISVVLQHTRKSAAVQDHRETKEHSFKYLEEQTTGVSAEEQGKLTNIQRSALATLAHRSSKKLAPKDDFTPTLKAEQDRRRRQREIERQ